MSAAYGALLGWLIFLVGIPVLLTLYCRCKNPEEVIQREDLEQRSAAHEALGVQPALLVELPYFPYGDGASETAECAICLEPFRQGQLCSEVPACRHAFHRDCLGLWAKSKGSCPLCRAKIIVLGSEDVVVPEDMV
ncbi:hypothetical protein PR202_ga17275 [Eleusine coracana subsp. coracana]|uniref:RING-type E3 ubiquitin transferase n=1 Tax=Eleusine coracana subsp. coracana TaxID=191504 RepID=A0AAV5CP03_ELECO|nr:hypothetical protein PR202_ga17275 [Eleusine coracana subsp. coracana]